MSFLPQQQSLMASLISKVPKSPRLTRPGWIKIPYIYLATPLPPPPAP